MEVEQIIEEIETYKPSGKFNLIGIPIMLVLGGVLGIAAAFIIHLIWQATGFYLMLLFPAGIGAAAGFGLRMGIKRGKCRNIAIGMMVGLIIGFLSYISMHYFDSLSYGAIDLMSYLKYMANEGYLIFFVIPISGIGAWITWIIEIGVAIFLTVSIAGWSSAEPYCEDCKQWCKKKMLFTSSNESSKDIITGLYNKEFNRLKDFKNDNFSDRDKLTIELSYCDNCLQKGYLTIKSVTPKGKKDETKENILISDAAVGAGGLDTLLKDFSAES